MMSFPHFPWVHWLQSRWKGNLHLRLTVGLAMVIVFVMGLGSAFMVYSQEKAFRHAAEAKGRAFSQAFALMGSAAVLKNLFIIQEAMSQHLDDPDVLQVDVIDEDNMIVAAKDTSRIGKTIHDPQWLDVRAQKQESVIYEKTAEGTPILVVVEPLMDEGVANVWIRIVFSLKEIEQEATAAMQRLVLITVILIFVSIFAVQVSQRKVSDAMRKLSTQLQGALVGLERAKYDHHTPSQNDMDKSRTVGQPHQGDFEKTIALVSETTKLLQHQTEILEMKVQERTEELKIARDQAMNATQAKSTFLAEMSHEIRTPMNGVVGMTELLLNTDLTPEQKKYSQTVKRSAGSLLTVLNGILELSKIEAGKIQMEVEKVDVRELVNEAVALLTPQASQKGLTLLSVIGPQVPCFLKSDYVRLCQILTNLISNAIKFTKEGEVVLSIALRENHSERSLLHFEVKDTGIGIAPEAQEGLFRSFSQVKGEGVPITQGTGLGLAISEKLVQLMGGDIYLHSTPGTGSTFWFDLWVDHTEDSQFDHEGLGLSSTMDPMDIHLGLHVLVVEDDPVNQEVALGMLKLLGCSTCLVQSGQEAVDAMNHTTYDLVLMDCHLPEMDGFAATTHIRQRESAFVNYSTRDERQEIPPGTPIIAMTASVLSHEQEHYQQVGFDDLLAKPFTLQTLKTILETWSLSRTNHLKDAGSDLHDTVCENPHPQSNQGSGITNMVIDPKVLSTLRRVASTRDPDFFRRVLEKFLKVTPDKLSLIEKAASCQDAVAMGNIAHTLKSSCGSIGAHTMWRLCERLEHMGHAGHSENGQQVVGELVAEYHHVREALLPHIPDENRQA